MKGRLRALVWMSALFCTLLSIRGASQTQMVWIEKHPTPSLRSGQAAAVLNGIMHVVGGSDASACSALTTHESYDPLTDQWTTKKPTMVQRSLFAAAVLNNGVKDLLYVVGGSTGCTTRTATVEAYDPDTDTWAFKASMPGGVRSALGAAVIDNRLYVAGGLTSDAWGGAGMTDVVEVYDPVADAWLADAHPLLQRRYAVTAQAIGGILYVLGGSDPQHASNSVEAYDPATNVWTPKAPLSVARFFGASTVVNGRLWAIGGQSLQRFEPSTEVYDPVTNAWSPGPELPSPRAYVPAVSAAGTIYVPGGFDGSRIVSTNYALENASASPAFSQLVPMPDGACICMPLSVNGNGIGSQSWFVKAGGGSLTIGVVALAVSDADRESVTATVFDSSGAQVAGPVTASYPAGTPQGTETTAWLAVGTVADQVYRVEVSTPNTPPTQTHYRLKFFGAREAGLPSPSINSFEGSWQDVPLRWLFNVNAGEQLTVRLFHPNQPDGLATSATVQIFDMAAPIEPVPIVDPASGAAVMQVTLNNPAGIDAIIRTASPAGSSGVYKLVLSDVDGQHRIARLDGADRGMYGTWLTSGEGRLSLTIASGTVPFTGSVLVTATATTDGTSTVGSLSVTPGTYEIGKIGVGNYQLEIAAPEGFVAIPSKVDFDITCETTAQVTVRIEPLNRAPVCAAAQPSPRVLWPVTHQMMPVTIDGVTDPDGDPVSIAITGIFQDEPVTGVAAGNPLPDGAGIGSSIAQLRAERAGSGNGRVYHVAFTASDGKGASCDGEVRVDVPHDRSAAGSHAIDEGAIYNSTSGGRRR